MTHGHTSRRHHGPSRTAEAWPPPAGKAPRYCLTAHGRQIGDPRLPNEIDRAECRFGKSEKEEGREDSWRQVSQDSPWHHAAAESSTFVPKCRAATQPCSQVLGALRQSTRYHRVRRAGGPGERRSLTTA
jgi:hypothetical protein